jgi:Flp pilus assembly protein TadD
MHDREAIQDLNRAAELLPDNFDLYYNRGCRYLSLGLLQEADSDFVKAQQLNPGDYEAYLNAGKKKGAMRSSNMCRAC